MWTSSLLLTMIIQLLRFCFPLHNLSWQFKAFPEIMILLNAPGDIQESKKSFFFWVRKFTRRLIVSFPVETENLYPYTCACTQHRWFLLKLVTIKLLKIATWTNFCLQKSFLPLKHHWGRAMMTKFQRQIDFSCLCCLPISSPYRFVHANFLVINKIDIYYIGWEGQGTGWW